MKGFMGSGTLICILCYEIWNFLFYILDVWRLECFLGLALWVKTFPLLDEMVLAFGVVLECDPEFEVEVVVAC